MTETISTDDAQRLASARRMALDIWGDEAAASRFMAHSHPLLDNRSPDDVARESADGQKKVEDILGHLKHGIPV